MDNLKNFLKVKQTKRNSRPSNEKKNNKSKKNIKRKAKNHQKIGQDQQIKRNGIKSASKFIKIFKEIHLDNKQNKKKKKNKLSKQILNNNAQKGFVE